MIDSSILLDVVRVVRLLGALALTAAGGCSSLSCRFRFWHFHASYPVVPRWLLTARTDSVYSFPSTSEKIGFELDLRGHSELLIAHAWLFSVASIAARSASRQKLAQLAMPGLAALGVALEVLFNVFDVVVGGIRSIRRPCAASGCF